MSIKLIKFVVEGDVYKVGIVVVVIDLSVDEAGDGMHGLVCNHRVVLSLRAHVLLRPDGSPRVLSVHSSSVSYLSASPVHPRLMAISSVHPA